MKLILLLLFISFSFSQNDREYYLKFYGNSYRQTDLFIDEDYSFVDQKNTYIFNTFSVDLTYRFSEIYQTRIVLPMVNVEFKDQDRFEFTDLRAEFHYYFNQYPNKHYMGVALKIPLGYDEKKDPWLSDGAIDLGLIYLIKTKFSDHMDYEIDIKFDYSVISTERINSGGYRIPFFISLSIYDEEITYLPVLSGAFKSYEYGNSEFYGDRYNEFSLDAGFIFKYKLQTKIELEISFLRTFFGFQSPVANHFGIGIAFGIRD